jgi:hypothetical protein
MHLKQAPLLPMQSAVGVALAGTYCICRSLRTGLDLANAVAVGVSMPYGHMIVTGPEHWSALSVLVSGVALCVQGAVCV